MGLGSLLRVGDDDRNDVSLSDSDVYHSQESVQSSLSGALKTFSSDSACGGRCFPSPKSRVLTPVAVERQEVSSGREPGGGRSRDREPVEKAKRAYGRAYDGGTRDEEVEKSVEWSKSREEKRSRQEREWRRAREVKRESQDKEEMGDFFFCTEVPVT